MHLTNLRIRISGWLGVWWLRPLYRAAVLVAAVSLAIYLVGLAQRQGWIRPTTSTSNNMAATESTTQYICPMMCTPPSSEPGRCPVCGMELVPASGDSQDTESKSVSIAAADRRLVGIKTVPATREAARRTVRAVGILEVDEGSLARIATDTGGRVESLMVNFAGQTVEKGEPLVTLYAPDLYAAQAELLTLKRTRGTTSGRSSSLADVREELIGGARERLLELGMTRSQVRALEQRGEADTRITIRSPQSGTVIKMMVREGEYVKPGGLICEVADLSNIWLITELFPEDAALVRYGQRVTAKISSLPGKEIEGRVSFIDPLVDSAKRAVRLRIDLPNPEARLRPGDEATVRLEVPLHADALMFDPELAGRWICPKHPEVVRDSPGTCPRSKRTLVPTQEFGFADSTAELEHPLVVPRSAVLMAGDHSVVYVETEPGEFEMRPVSVGAKLDDQLVILSGLEPGERVAVEGNFLIDSQMQLSGKPSLIDPSRAAPPEEAPWSIEVPDISAIEILDGENSPSTAPLPSPMDSGTKPTDAAHRDAPEDLPPHDHIMRLPQASVFEGWGWWA